MSRDPQRRFDLWYVLAAPFETAIAVAALIASVVGLADPHVLGQAAIGRTVGTLVYAWTVLYAVGALGVLAGLFVRSVRVEAAGLCLFIGAILTNAIAITDVSGAQGVVSATTFAALAGACVGRLAALTRAWREGA